MFLPRLGNVSARPFDASPFIFLSTITMAFLATFLDARSDRLLPMNVSIQT